MSLITGACVLILTAVCSVCSAQTDPAKSAADPGHLLQEKLDLRLPALEEPATLLRAIAAGLVEAEKHEEVKDALVAELKSQQAAVNEWVALGPVPTPASVAAALEKLAGPPDPPSRPATGDEGDLAALQAYLAALDSAGKELARRRAPVDTALQAVTAEEKGALDILKRERAAREAASEAAKTAAEAVKKLESGAAFGPAQWPEREAAFKLMIVARVASEKLKHREAELSSGVLAARRSVLDGKIAALTKTGSVISAEVGRVSALVQELEAQARRERADTREELREELADAKPFEQAFFEMQLATLDAKDASGVMTQLQTEWTDKITNGVIKDDLDEAASLARRIVALQEDADESTDELRRMIEGHRSRLQRLKAAYKELIEARKRARADRHAADRAQQAAKELPALEAEAKASAPENSADPDWADWVFVQYDWDGQETAHHEAIRAWKKVAGDLALSSSRWADDVDSAINGLEDDVADLRAILLWTRQESKISMDAVKQAFEDAQDLPEESWRAIEGQVDVWREVATADENRDKAVWMIAVSLLLGAGLVVVHRKLPETYSWLEGREGEEAGLFRVLAAGVRRSEIVFFVALIYCGICAVWGVWPWQTGVLAVLALTPFVYRFLRVLLDVLFHPTDTGHRLIDVDNTLARILHRAGRWLLNLSLLFGMVGLLLRTGGYAEMNPGFTELWWFLYQTVFSLILLVGVGRPSVIRRMIRGTGRVATSVKTLILVLYPLVVGGVLFLLVLNALRYREAVAFFRSRFLATAAVLAVVFFVFRILQRRMLPDRDWKRTVDAEDFEDDQQFLAEGRKWFYDLLARLGLRLLVGIPALLFLAAIWRGMDWAFLDAKIFGDDGSLTYNGLIWGVLSIWFTIVVLKHYRRWLRFVILPAMTIDQGLGYAVLTLSSYVVLAIGLVISLNLLEVQGDQIAVVLSALMVGIGFGLKDIVTNFISGIMLLVERPLKVGDQVMIGDDLGTVDKINLRSTTIMTFDNVGVVVPNADLVTGKLINRSTGTPLLRTVVAVGVGYDSDVRQVMEIIQSVLDDHGLVLKKPGTSIYFVGFGDNSLDFSVRFWAKMSDNRMQIAGDVRAAILARFREAEIEIPFPQRDLHVRSIDAAAVMRTSAVTPPSGGPKKPVVDAGPVALPQQPSDEDAQRAASEDDSPADEDGRGDQE